MSQCTFGTPQQNSAGGLFAEVNCPNGGTSDDKEAACNSRGWDYRGGKCYMKGTLKIGSEEYNWITPLDDGVCPDGWFYNATLKSCLDRICDCDEGDCGNPEISVCSGNTVTQYSCMQEARAKCSNGYVGCEKDSNGCYTYTCNSPTPGTSTPGTDPTPTNKCYYCWISSTSGVYTVATSEKEALTIVKRSHSSATSCQLEVDSTKCAGAPPTSTSTSTGTISCYRCKVSSSGYMYTKAKTPDEAATITKGIDCVTVAESMCKVPSSTSTSTSTPVVNPPTGGTAIIIAWIIGIFAIVYSVWYFSKNSELEKK